MMRSSVLSAILIAAAASPAFPQSAGPNTRTVEYESPSVGRRLRCSVILPVGYDSSDRRYPVLYLLHGYSGDYTSWSRHGAERTARGYEMIVVLADGGNSWYVNWAKPGPGEKGAWEDALVKDLVGYVDSHFRSVATREGRAINGLSMGGYGALSIGLRNPDTFCSIGSTSGAVDMARSYGRQLAANPGLTIPTRNPSAKVNPAIGMEDFDSQEERTPHGRMFTTVAECEAHDPFALVQRIKPERLPHINIDCGTEDPFIGHNQEFLRLLMERKVPFTYAQSSGEHRGAYWSRELGHAMAIQQEIMRRSLSARAARPGGTASDTRARPDGR